MAQGDQSGQDRGDGGHGARGSNYSLSGDFQYFSTLFTPPCVSGGPPARLQWLPGHGPSTRLLQKPNLPRCATSYPLDTRLRRREEGGRPSSRAIHLASLSGLGFLICEVGATRALAALGPWAEKTALVQHLPGCLSFLLSTHPAHLAGSYTEDLQRPTERLMTSLWRGTGLETGRWKGIVALEST